MVCTLRLGDRVFNLLIPPSLKKLDCFFSPVNGLIREIITGTRLSSLSQMPNRVCFPCKYFHSSVPFHSSDIALVKDLIALCLVDNIAF